MTPSVYTVQLRQLITGGHYTRAEIEGWFKDYELTDYLTADEIAVINDRGTWNKDKLAAQIVDHYLMREIGLETPALFEHHAKVLMKEIMEEKLPLIYSASIEYDPLVNVDYKETYAAQRAATGSATTTGQSASNTSGLTINSDTPQGEISKTEILSGKYATSTGASEAADTSSTNGSSTSSDNSSENYTKQIKGNSGVSATAQALIRDYRKTIVTINKDIIEDLNVLFMGLYNNKF